MIVSISDDCRNMKAFAEKRILFGDAFLEKLK
jgi:hypothetical protein